MENEKERWVATRTDILSTYYDVPSTEQPRVDALVERMRQVAAACPDQGTFEMQLMQQGLSNEFNTLMASLAPYYKQSPQQPAGAVPAGSADEAYIYGNPADAGEAGSVLSDVGDMVKDEVVSDVKHMGRRAARGAVRSVLGDQVSDLLFYGTDAIPGVPEARMGRSLWRRMKDSLKKDK